MTQSNSPQQPANDDAANAQSIKKPGSDERGGTAKPEGDGTAHVEVQPLKHENAAADFGSDQSFPASDPPANTPIRQKDHDAGSQ